MFFLILLAISKPSSVVELFNNTRNSSPPYLPTKSVSLTDFFIVLPNIDNTSSPFRWPYVSLIFLNLSISMINKLNELSLLVYISKSLSNLSSKYFLVYVPVTLSVVDIF